MPTNHDETLHERYAREHQVELGIYARMTPEQISDMVTELHNALAARDAALAELAALKGGQEAVAWLQRPDKDGDAEVLSFYPLREFEAANGWAEVPLYTAPPAQSSAWVPEGWKLVPIQMTDEMRDAGNIYVLNRGTLVRIWADMLAAAPTPGASDGK